MPQAGIGRAVGAGPGAGDGWLVRRVGGTCDNRRYRAMSSQPTEPALEVSAPEEPAQAAPSSTPTVPASAQANSVSMPVVPASAKAVPTAAEITPALLKTHSITADEYASIEKKMGRVPSLTELGIFSVMRRGHCT